MIERNIKKLLLNAIKETGDNPKDVKCIYSIGFPLHIGVDPPEQKCLASDLPEGELSALTCYSEKHRYKLVRKEPQIETSVRKARRDAPRN
jgi:hypothetical protein